MSDQPTTCDRLAEAVSLLAAGCLANEEDVEVREHLEGCADCRERFRQLCLVAQGVEHAYQPQQQVGGRIVAKAMRQIAAGRTERSGSRRRLWLAAGLALAASLLVILAWDDYQTYPTPEPPGPPTLLAYERAFAQSDEAFERLLNHQPRRSDRPWLPITIHALDRDLTP